MRNLKLRNAIGAFIAVAVLSITAITSCTNDDEPKYEVQTEQGIDAENLQFAEFLMSVDSLKSNYAPIVTRGDGDNCYVTIADAAGGFVGWLIGGRIGVGKKRGAGYCSSLASAIVELALSCQEIIPVNSVTLAKQDFSVISSRYGDDVTDSLGYYHNCIMVKITQDRAKYTVNDSVNMGLIYDDVVSYCKDYGLYATEFDAPEMKTRMLTQVGNMCDMLVQCGKGELSKEEFVERQSKYLKREYGLTDLERGVFKDYIAKETFYCATLDDNLLRKYAKDLDREIEASAMSNELKKEVSSVSQIIVNSTLCWR